MKKLSLGIQAFSKIIDDNCVYVDKTKHIYQLIQGNCYFFSRPRRFGKSLLCSTLKDIFLGKKYLFKDLWIEKNTDFPWHVHPVIHIDFLLIAHDSPKELTASLMRLLNDISEGYEVGPLVHTTPGEMLKKLVLKLLKKYGDQHKVVLIIDEYDKPILEHINNTKLAAEMRDLLSRFYVFIKGLDEYLRFVFITGVSRFAKTSIFSGLNQLVDISMDPRYAHLVGYTDAEIDIFFPDYLEKATAGKIVSKEQVKEKLRFWYNGYKFWNDQPFALRIIEGEEPKQLYAPISVLKYFDLLQFQNYWFDTATPKMLLEIMERNNYPLEKLENPKASPQELAAFDIDHLSFTTLLFQTGYLTIKTYDEVSKNYIFTIPNQEVNDSLFNCVLSFITRYKDPEINDSLKNLYDSLRTNEIDNFIAQLKLFYANIPYTIAIEQEKYYQTIFYVILKLIKLNAIVEVATNIGRIDMTVELKDTIYIFEFKLNKSAKAALQQIYTNKYYEPYLNHNKKIVLIGINFSSKEKNITEYLSENLS